MNIIQRGGINHTLQGYYLVSVVDGETNEVVWQQDKLQKNLILNAGMDAVASQYYADLLSVAIAGTGTRLNYIDPAGSMLSQTGTTITLIPTGSGTGLNHLTQSFGNYSIAVEAGDVIQYATGSGSITSVTVLATSDLTASVDTSLTISPSQSFTIWKTTQTGLQTEIKRSNTYLVGASNCGTSSAVGNQTYFRTFDFTTESILRAYNEIGVSWTTSTASATIFSRVVLTDPVAVDVGQRLRVFYELSIDVGPSSGSNRPNVTITGWPVSPSTNTNGTESVQIPLFSAIDSTGTSVTSNIVALEPNSSGAQCTFFISNVSSSIQSWGSAISRVGTSPTAARADSTKLAYTNGSYIQDKTATFTAASYDGTNIHTMGFGVGGANNPAAAGTQAFLFLFEQSQSKANTQTLTLSWRWSWGRTLSN